MSEDDQRLRLTDTKTVVKVLTVALVAVAGTFLYVWSGQTTIEVEAPKTTGADDVYSAKKDGMSTTNYGRGKFLAATAVIDDNTTRNDATDINYFAEPKQNRVMEINYANARGQKLDGRLVAEDSRATGRSLNTSIVEEPTISRIGTSQNVLEKDADGFKTGWPYLVDHKNDGGPMTVDHYAADPKANVVIDIGYKVEKTTVAAAAAEADTTSIGHSNANDLFYDPVDDGGAYRYGEISVKGYGQTADDEPQRTLYAEQSSAPVKGGLNGGGGYGRVPYVFKTRYPVGHTLDFGSSTTVSTDAYGGGGGGPSIPPDGDFHERRIENKIDWRNVGVLMALGKLGLFKLLTIAFLQYMSVLGFKLKLFAIAVSFKFLLLLKLVKISKVLMLPLFFTSFLPILTSRFNRLNDTQTSTAAAATTAGLGLLSNAFNEFSSQASGSSQGGSFVSGFFSGFIPAAADPVPSFLGGVGSPILGGGMFRNLFDDDGAAPAGIPSETRSALVNKHDHSDFFFDKRHGQQSSEPFDLIAATFQMMLDSEKCANNIACRIAVAEKAGVMSVWINWILSGLSKIIPEGLLRSYFKTYNEVKNGIHTKLSRTED